MKDYTRTAATADRLITKFGRPVTFINPSDTPVDPTRPWDGNTSAGDTSVTLNAVMVPPNTVRQFGLTALGEGTEFRDLVTFSQEILIAYPEDNDLRQFNHILDGTPPVRWTVIGLQVLKPATVQLLAFVGVRR